MAMKFSETCGWENSIPRPEKPRQYQILVKAMFVWIAGRIAHFIGYNGTLETIARPLYTTDDVPPAVRREAVRDTLGESLTRFRPAVVAASPGRLSAASCD